MVRSTIALVCFAILTGLPGARGDELNVNQQLLSERLDQLSTVGLQPGSGAYLGAEQNQAAGTLVTGGSFPRSILIPGTETSVKISGTISEHLDYWMSGGPANGLQTNNTGATGQLQVIPLHNTAASARSNGIFSQTPNASRLIIETRTPTAWGEARTAMAWDWGGSNAFIPGGANPTSVSNNLSPRLFYDYGTLGGFLAGQANSNFRDVDAGAEVVEFGGNTGGQGVARVPQVRYTMQAWWGGSFSVSAEAPETDIGTPGGVLGSDAGNTSTLTPGACTFTPPANVVCAAPTLLTSGQLPTNVAKTSAPDLTAAYYLPQPWGHFSISAAIRPGMTVSDGQFLSKHFIGFGGQIGLDIKPGWFGWGKDDFTFTFTGGDALGRYLNSQSDFALATNYGTAGGYGAFGGPTTAVAAAKVIFKPTTELGGEVGYQHWWDDNLRSSISYGFLHHDIPANLVGAAQAGAMNKELMTAHANVIWSPDPSFDIALEYMWGQRRVVNNQTGTENVLINRFRILY